MNSKARRLAAYIAGKQALLEAQNPVSQKNPVEPEHHARVTQGQHLQDPAQNLEQMSLYWGHTVVASDVGERGGASFSDDRILATSTYWQPAAPRQYVGKPMNNKARRLAAYNAGKQALLEARNTVSQKPPVEPQHQARATQGQQLQDPAQNLEQMSLAEAEELSLKVSSHISAMKRIEHERIRFHHASAIRIKDQIKVLSAQLLESESIAAQARFRSEGLPLYPTFPITQEYLPQPPLPTTLPPVNTPLADIAECSNRPLYNQLPSSPIHPPLFYPANDLGWETVQSDKRRTGVNIRDYYSAPGRSR